MTNVILSTGIGEATDDEARLLPLVPYIGHDAVGNPALVGSRCSGCDTVLLGAPATCPRCGARDKLSAIVLANAGRLYNFTTVHRSLPGVKVPFVFAIVDLDGGGTVKGNLVADTAEVAFDMPVRIVFEPAPMRDGKGRSYLSYHFEKA